MAVAVSGSAPALAYVFMFIEAMADADCVGMPRSRRMNLPRRQLEVQDGARYGKTSGRIKDMVCSPAGTTIGCPRSGKGLTVAGDRSYESMR